MADTRIYKLDLSGADISAPTVYWSTSFGGSDAPLAGYPDIARLENMQRNESAGASGQHTLDCADTGDYTTGWVVLGGVAETPPVVLPFGQYDARGGGAGHPLKCRWKQHFNSNALAETGTVYPLVMIHGMNSGNDDGMGAGNIFLELQMLQDAGANFEWFCRFRKVSGTAFTLSGTNILGSADVADNLEHEIIVTIVPATVTGAYNGAGSLGSAVVAADGSIVVTVDGVEVLNGSGKQFVINQLASSNPEVYYGRGLWHGIA